MTSQAEKDKAIEDAEQSIMTALRRLMETDGVTLKDVARMTEQALHDAVQMAKLDGVIDS